MENSELIILLEKYQKGDKNSFHLLYEELKKPIFYNIYSIIKDYEISEDLLQDTFLKMLENIKKINKRDSLLGYLMVISRNLSLDYLKKNKRLNLDDDVIESEEKDEKRILHDEVKDNTNYNELLFKIKEILKPKEYTIFTLHLLDDLSYKEISEIMHIPIGTLTYTYNEVLKKIASKLERSN